MVLESDIFELNYNNLYVFGTIGKSPYELREGAGALRESPYKFKSAFLRKMGLGSFLPVFHLRPPVEIGLREGGGLISIVSYGMNSDVAKDITKNLSDLIKLTPSQSGNFRRNLKLELDEVLSRAYHTWEYMAHSAGNTLENTFGFIHYLNFLTKYAGIPQLKAKQAAEKEFGRV